MQWIPVIVGGLIGLWFAAGGNAILGLAAGAALGYLFAQLRSLQDKVKALSTQLERSSDTRPPTETQAPVPESEPELEPLLVRPLPETPAAPATAAKKAVEQRAPISISAEPRPASPGLRAPDPIDRLVEMAKRWLTTGNVPVKLGVIVSFFGVAFLLRYAVDQGYIVISIEARYLAVTAVAGVLLAIGWRLREKLPVYALSLQGGGIGMLYLTIFAAFRLHEIVPAPFAFVLLLALIVFTGVLAVLQESMSLATLGTIGGFLAPVLVSTGAGNHVALFSYYLLLNAAIVGIAWHRAWRLLNVLGFVFTFGVGTLWGYEYYRPELFASTEPFLIAFFLFYQAIAVLFAFRQPPELRGIVDGTLVFGTPVIAFALQSQLVEGTEYGLAISATTVAVFYTLLASWLHRAQGKQMRLLIESFIALSVAFATIAIPLALDERWTAAAWSLEGAALIWISVKQQRLLARLAGSALLGAAGVAYIEYGWTDDLGLPVLNGNFLGGMLISVASLFSARYLAADKNPIDGQSFLSAPLLLWGLGWWLGTGSMEIADRISGDAQLHTFTAFIAISVGLLAWIGRRYDWTAARRATLAFLPVLPLVAILYLFEHEHLLEGIGTLSWVLAALAHFALLRAYDNGRGRIESVWHFAGVLFLVAIIAYEVYWRMGEAVFSDVWSGSGAMLVPALAAIFIVMMRQNIAWPLQRYWSAYLAAAGVLIIVQLLTVAIAGIDDPGNPQPLPYIPILNPFDVLTIVGLGVALHLIVTLKMSSEWLGQGQVQLAITLWSLAAFALSTIAVVRGVHHFGDIPWQQRVLTNSVSVQSALSIYWAILGFGGMIWGARHLNRSIWIVGTVLMAIVVIKLFIIDLGNTGTVARIVSFLGVGALLLVVGYYAPAPPRQVTDAAEEI
jgi:uncharacterized membrane protein